jgi:hypothetical protein
LPLPLEVKFPPGGRTFRGGLLPAEHLPFYTVGKQYRVPGYLASSFNEKIAMGFAKRAWQSASGQTAAVIFVVQVEVEGERDADELCQNANFITNTLVPGEDEYLFVPYSARTYRIAFPLSPFLCPIFVLPALSAARCFRVTHYCGKGSAYTAR